MLRYFLYIVVAAIGLLFIPLANADYLCSTKERDYSAAQLELYNRAAVAMRAALLPPPEGWVMSQLNTQSRTGKYCADFKNEPVTFGASVNYVVKPTADQLRRYRVAQIAQTRELKELSTLPAELQAKVDALEAQSSAIRKEGREAERAKNGELAKAKYAEALDLNRKAQAIRETHDTSIQAQQRALFSKYKTEIALSLDTSISVSLEGNGQMRVPDTATERIVLGNATKTNQATDKLVRIVASIDRTRGTPEQHAIAKGLIDMTKLKAMIGGNIPTLEESKIAIAAQNDAIALGNTKARELEKAIENEGRREAEAAQIAKRQASEAERAAIVNKPATSNTSLPSTASAAATPVAPPPAAPPPATPSAAPAKTTSPAEAANQAKDAVNKLKGLFGR